MIEILNFEVEYLENAGCNNGKYPTWSGINAETGETISGITCRCGRGCANTDYLKSVDGKTYLVLGELSDGRDN
jgi:hypothetical protein